ncbi:hypothetical protein B9Q09_03925, partial [Candidatus Marsarchaeota G2 archaeon ECH_B_SAG-C16]
MRAESRSARSLTQALRLGFSVCFRCLLKRIYNSLNLICMEGMSLIKNQFLELLDQDEEFRLAVAAKLGITAINQKLDKILENQEKLWLEVKSLREGQEKLW